MYTVFFVSYSNLRDVQVCLFSTIAKVPTGIATIGKSVVDSIVQFSMLRSPEYTDSEYTCDGRFYGLYSDLLYELLEVKDIDTRLLLTFYQAQMDSDQAVYKRVAVKIFDLVCQSALTSLSSFNLSYSRCPDDGSMLAASIVDQVGPIAFASSHVFCTHTMTSDAILFLQYTVFFLISQPSNLYYDCFEQELYINLGSFMEILLPSCQSSRYSFSILNRVF